MTPVPYLISKKAVLDAITRTIQTLLKTKLASETVDIEPWRIFEEMVRNYPEIENEEIQKRIDEAREYGRKEGMMGFDKKVNDTFTETLLKQVGIATMAYEQIKLMLDAVTKERDDLRQEFGTSSNPSIVRIRELQKELAFQTEAKNAWARKYLTQKKKISAFVGDIIAQPVEDYPAVDARSNKPTATTPTANLCKVACVVMGGNGENTVRECGKVTSVEMQSDDGSWFACCEEHQKDDVRKGLSVRAI